MKNWLLFMLCAFVGMANAQEAKWELKKDKNDIKVYVREATDSPFKGLGKVMQYLTVHKVRAAGYTYLIHALMAVNNASAKISNAYEQVQPFKKYQLFYNKI